MKNKKKFFVLLLISTVALVSLFLGIMKLLEYISYTKATPYDVLISDIESNSVTISWKSDNDAPSYIKIGESDKLFGKEESVKYHRVKLSGLKELSKYSFAISDGKREWEKAIDNSTNLERYTIKEFIFSTTEQKEEITLPKIEEINVLPNELIYVVLKSGDQYSNIRSYSANRFGGITVDTNAFNIPAGDIEIININYITSQRGRKNNVHKIFASDVNCNQDVSAQSIDGVSREGFTDLATRWVAGRGKNYAKECFNDVVYRAKREGVDPAFALTIWLNESGASNYTQNANLSGMVEDFGIHGNPSVPVQNFNKQIDHFLTLTHSYSCPGLSAWEAWGNMYRWGNCNENDPVKRQVGIDYYKGIETAYGWVTNGRKLPGEVTGLPKSGDDGGSEDNPEQGSLCCALKIDNQEQFQGDYENNVAGKTCEQVWSPGRNLYGGKLEYSVEIKGKGKSSCEVKYEGVCCKISGQQIWYPKTLCTEVVPNIYSSNACTQNATEKKCYFKDGKYQWLPISTGDDYIKEITTQTQCDERNRISVHKISLTEGVNFVGFDFNPMYKGSAMLASNLVESSSDVLLVGNFEGYGWKDLIKKSEKLPFAGNDFTLEQNKGYLVITNKDTTIEFDGWKKSSAEYSNISDGWNLVGGTLYTKSYRASSLIKSLAGKSISVDTVGVWNLQTGMFSYRKEEGEQIYGEDITLKANEAIFLRNTSGK